MKRALIVWLLLFFPAEAAPAAEPRVWFAPLPPLPLRPYRSYLGSLDYMSLFAGGAPWTQAAGHVRVFKVYGEWIDTASETELKTMIAELNRRNIALAWEIGAVNTDGSCGLGVEGFVGSVDENLFLANRLKAAGGEVLYAAMDEPFFFGNLYDGPGACHWSGEKLAASIADTVRAMRGVFPDVVFGDIEPILSSSQAPLYAQWMDTYRSVTGSNLAFFHADMAWWASDWYDSLKALRESAEGRQIPFGIIYNGDDQDRSDAEWTGHAEERAFQYESRSGRAPDNVIFQSWHDHPDYVLPENEPTTFTNLIDRYFRTRTKLTLALSQGEATGALTDAGGAPVSNARVTLTAIPTRGSGLFGEYAISGVVPTGATEAVVGFRGNEECGCQGAALDFTLYEIRYLDGEGKQRVANSDLSRGLEGWGVWGTGSARLEASDRSAQALRVTAAPAQFESMNSAAFSVPAGTAYTVTFAARVAPGAERSAYFTVIFLANGSEILRSSVWLQPAAVMAGNARTDANGAFRVKLDSIPLDEVSLQAEYSGDDGYWPACLATAGNPCSFGGGSQASGAAAASNPVPGLSLLSPSRLAPAGPGFTLAVYGSNFVPGSLLRWNGKSRTTQFISSTKLEANLSASDISSAGTAQVTVLNPPSGGGISNALSFTLDSGPVPAITSGGTVSSASYTNRVGGGMIAAVFGKNLAGGILSAGELPLPTMLSGTTVRVNGVPAPLFFVAPFQINFQVPWGVLRQSSLSITVTTDEGSSAEEVMPAHASAPAIFSLDASGGGQGAVLIANSAVIAAPAGSIPGRVARPVERGDTISIFCTGLGAVDLEPTDGVAASGTALSRTTTSPVATIGGIPATISFSGLAPTLVTLYQVNAQVPANVSPGDAVPVTVTIGGLTSNTVTIAVR